MVKVEPAKKAQNAVRESSKKFRKAPSRDARELGLAKKGKSVEPAGIKVISKRKETIKSELLNFNPAKPSKKARKYIDDNWLIDKAFDKLVDAGKTAGKIAGKTAGKAVKEGFKATKAGVRGFNEISDEIVKNPMLVRMGQVYEATLHGMALQHRHALGSITAVGANRRYVTTGSLVKQHGHVAHTNTQAVAPYPTQNQVIPKVIHRKGGDQVRYFLPTGQEVSAAVARKLLHGSVSVPTQANNASTTIEHTYSRDNTTQIVQKFAKNASGLVRRNKSDGSVNKTRIATPACLFHRHNSGVV